MKAKGHQIAGGVVGGLWVLGKWSQKQEINPDEPFPLGEFMLYTAAGATIASLPDWIEPATGNPNHRQFFHSMTFVAMIVALKQSAWLKSQPPLVQQLIHVVIFQYLVHVGGDALTPRSLPLIHTSFA